MKSLSAIKIPFNRPPYLGTELGHISTAIHSHKICGDGAFTKKCSDWLEASTGCGKALLTTSGTSALEMAAILADIKEGDEVIMPSFTFVSTANAFVIRGSRIVFIDIRPDTMNIDERQIEAAITEHTKAIVPVHYAGVSCEMDTIMNLAETYRLQVIEDAAQAITSRYKGRPLGTLGNFGCLSFHETKNVSMGEGGAIFLRDSKNFERAEIIREKGTDRSKFFRGEIDKYTWADIGSSYLPSELNAAYLLGQLESIDLIIKDRMKSWNIYMQELAPLAQKGRIEVPHIPDECEHNAHIFYIKVKDIHERTALISSLKEKGISAVFHYIPLHSSPAGCRYGRFCGDDIYTTKESERLVRLPLYYNMGDAVYEVSDAVRNFFS
ncbi:MAG: dTDP-4-amino-4,6-dideoxygalactose transaminase [Roseburia sp.]|jgi:dTDP-4-amino-4,6-dideoxygalactose transaminase|nr:dTDP-4-amino-4,6-dideoxygalactose transaminase [Roseburia sp.]